MILYDGDCPLCCTLAQFAARRPISSLVVSSWQDYVVSEEARKRHPDDILRSPASQLRALTMEGELLDGPEAWTYILAQHPDFKQLHWLAERLGLAKTVANSLERTGHFLRRMCARCLPTRLLLRR